MHVGHAGSVSSTAPSLAVSCYGHKSSTGTVRRLFHQKSYDSTAPVRRPAGGRKNRRASSVVRRASCVVRKLFYLNIFSSETTHWI